MNIDTQIYKDTAQSILQGKYIRACAQQKSIEGHVEAEIAELKLSEMTFPDLLALIAKRQLKAETTLVILKGDDND